MCCRPTVEREQRDHRREPGRYDRVRKWRRKKKLDAPPIKKLVAAVSAGILDGNAIVDLNYEEDKA